MQKIFKDPTGFEIILETGPTAKAPVDQLTDNYMKANCPIAQKSAGGFVAWNPPPQKDPNDPRTAYLGMRLDPETSANYYINDYDREYLESLQGLIASVG